MVIGNGMLATRFMKFKDDGEKIIFASGVSHSKDTVEQHYFREFELLKKTVNTYPEKTLVYFSTCSVTDKDAQNEPYIIHKKAIELFIGQNVPKHYLFRVSNVAGTSNNPYTLINYFVFNILQNQPITIWENAYRNIIGLEDMFDIANIVLQQNKFLNTTINIANPENYSVPFILKTIETYLGKKALSTIVKRGDNYFIDTTAIQPIIQQLQIPFHENYLANLLKQYYHSR